MGHPLSQTVFTSLYIDKLLDITQEIWEKRRFADATGHESLCLRTLRAYCLGLIMTCSVVNNRIKSEHFYEVWFPPLVDASHLRLDRKRIWLLIPTIEASWRE